MACLRCGYELADQMQFCPQCKSPVIRFPTFDPPSQSLLDLGEDANFREPAVHYHTEELLRLESLFQAVVAEEDVLEEFAEQLERLGEVFDESIVGQIQPALDKLLVGREEKELAEIVYVLKTGIRLFYQGQDELWDALEGEEGLFQTGFKNLVDGHDYLYFGKELAEELLGTQG